MANKACNSLLLLARSSPDDQGDLQKTHLAGKRAQAVVQPVEKSREPSIPDDKALLSIQIETIGEKMRRMNETISELVSIVEKKAGRTSSSVAGNSVREAKNWLIDPKGVVTCRVSKFKELRKELSSMPKALVSLVDIEKNLTKVTSILVQLEECGHCMDTSLLNYEILDAFPDVFEKTIHGKQVGLGRIFRTDEILETITALTNAAAGNFSGFIESKGENPWKCPYGDGYHFLEKCQLSRNARWEVVRKEGLCQICLSREHPIEDCERSCCTKCDRLHHRSLCQRKKSRKQWNN